MKENGRLESAVIFTVLAAAFSTAAIYALSIPTVQVSNTTHKCVKVVPSSAGSCDNLPAKYERVWVK